MQLTTAGRIDEAIAAVADGRELETYNERWNEPIVLMVEADVALKSSIATAGDGYAAAALAHARGAHALAWRAEALISAAVSCRTPAACSHGGLSTVPNARTDVYFALVTALQSADSSLTRSCSAGDRCDYACGSTTNPMAAMCVPTPTSERMEHLVETEHPGPRVRGGAA